MNQGLPEYEAISFQRIIRKGGHTEPWSVIVQTPQGPKQYIVKLYTTSQIESKNCVTAEVVGNVLAKEFDLHAPTAALIHFSNDFVMRLGREEQSVLDKRDERVKFGTELIEGHFRFESGLEETLLTKYLEVDTLYAFDSFIRNGDRGQRKPNLLLTALDKAWVIDHEMALDFSEETKDNLIKGIWEERFTRYHISYDYLINSQTKIEEDYFNAFEELTRTVNLNILIPYFNQLEAHFYDTNRVAVLSYLQFVKQNCATFVEILRKSLR
ncbi:hypothetical protein KK062_00305 [Fulvivirgaceae bacterium PWU5]|uniref:HipA-like kinase domain-containing protein n=1 Tax=Dawidia cretensis TaxID=2782350 RepID=A0AAP2DUS0_9BACT|nr:HipA family kinase [Dawidia cretensis]MBT1706638.1 hypothetical protein [Dawidia cretensis]